MLKYWPWEAAPGDNKTNKKQDKDHRYGDGSYEPQRVDTDVVTTSLAIIWAGAGTGNLKVGQT